MRPMPASSPIASLRGIGPKTAAWLVAAGIETEAALRALGAVEAYRKLKANEPHRVSLNALWGLHAALEGIPWTAVDAGAKQRLLVALTAAELDDN